MSDYNPNPAGAILIPIIAGLLTYPVYRAFPVFSLVAMCDKHLPPRRGKHSNGYCSGFTPDSLFIQYKSISWNYDDAKLRPIF